MQAWLQFLEECEKKLGAEVVATWLRTLKIARFDAANLYLEAKDSFQANWFEEHIRPAIRKGLLNNNQRPVRVHLSVPVSKSAVLREAAVPQSAISPDPLDPEMTLDSFLPSEANLMAHKLLSELKTGAPFNPVFLYGPKGSGKTHLLMGAAHALQKTGKRVYFVKAATFTEHVVQAIRQGYMQTFRRIYRDIDALIVDDIHIFSKKHATQEEFFHTFNTLHTLGRLILLSANAAPSSLQEIEPRLISRFEWGLSIGLKNPDMRPIFEKKAALWNLSLSAETADWLLAKFDRDPLLALQALGLRWKGAAPIQPHTAELLLKDLLGEQEKRAWTPEKIVKAVAAHYGIRSEDLLGKSQMRECAIPRQAAMYLCREKLKMPYQKIGEFFHRDHSTVMSSVKLIQKAVEEKKREVIEAIEKIASMEL